MEHLLPLLAAYGLCFGLMNDKAKPITDWMRAIPFRVRGSDAEATTFFERMLACPYCTGFHCGWVLWLVLGCEPVGSGSGVVGTVAAAPVWAFASAIFCYLVDTMAQWFEASIQGQGLPNG